MKAIIVLIAVAMALVGAAAAWDSTNNLQYQYTKVVNTQAGEHLNWFGPVHHEPDASSSAQFSGQGAYGAESAHVSNYIDNIMAELVPVYGTTPDTHDVLTQYGSAVVSTKAPDLQNPAGVIKSGTATAGENLALSGNYGMYTDRDSISALFSNLADVSIGGITASTAPDRSDYPVSPDTPGRFSAEIEPENGARIVDANLGSEATVGFEKINAIGAVPTLSGGVNNWASFSGAYNPNGGNIDDIETSVANEQGFTLTF